MEQPLAVNAENSRAKVQNVGGDSSGSSKADHLGRRHAANAIRLAFPFLS